jgi:hypothetical protein
MATSQFVRWSGVAAAITGIFGILAALGTGDSAPWVYAVSNIATVFALVGIYIFQRQKAGTFGMIAFLVALGGALLVTFAFNTETSTLIYAVGLILIAIVALRAKSFPAWVPWLWLAATIIGIPGTFMMDLQETLFLVGAILFGAGFIGAGWTLWKSS